MGGNIQFEVDTVDSVSATVYDGIIPQLISDLNRAFYELDLYFQVIPSYRNKETFGDIDVIYGWSKIDAFPTDYFLDLLHFIGHHAKVNGSIISFPYEFESDRYIQIDLIRVPENLVCFARNYFAWNDLGNLIGKVARAMGFKFGQNGLTYVIRSGTRVIKEVLITDVFHEALEFLGYNSLQYNEGFDTLSDIFEYAVSSKYHPYVDYSLEALSHKDRTRDKKRKTYHAFLDFLKNTKRLKNYSSFSKIAFRTEHLQRAFSEFPEFAVEYASIVHEDLLLNEAKLKFSGDHIQEITGLTDTTLGKFIQFLRANIFILHGNIRKDGCNYRLINDRQESWLNWILYNDFSILKDHTLLLLEKFQHDN